MTGRFDTPDPDFHEGPEDAEVERLCLKWGFGAVMASAARQWSGRDRVGALTVGPTLASLRAAQMLAEQACDVLTVLRFAEAGITLADLLGTPTPGDRARVLMLRQMIARFGELTRGL